MVDMTFRATAIGYVSWGEIASDEIKEKWVLLEKKKMNCV